MAGFIYWCCFLMAIAIGALIFANSKQGKKTLEIND